MVKLGIHTVESLASGLGNGAGLKHRHRPATLSIWPPGITGDNASTQAPVVQNLAMWVSILSLWVLIKFKV